MQLTKQTRKENDAIIDYYDVSKLTPAEWSSLRSSLFCIGGSDIGTICGVNKWMDAATLWRRKIGLEQKNFQGNAATTTGHFFEPAIREMWCHGDSMEEIEANRMSGNKIRDAHDPYVTYFPRHMPWMALNLDGEITREPEWGYLGKGVLECKKLSKRASETYVGGLPPSYVFQLQGYMIGLKAKYGFLAAQVGEFDFISRPFEINGEILDLIFQKCLPFYEAMKEGRDVMQGKGSIKEKYEKIFEIEEKYNDIIAPQNWELLNQWLVDPVSIDMRKDEVTLTEDMVAIAEEYKVKSREENKAKLAKQELGGRLKYWMQKQGAKVARSESLKVKFEKRLSITANKDGI